MPSEFKIQVDPLTETPARFEFEASARWWLDRQPEPSEGQEDTPETPFSFELDCGRQGDAIDLEGTLTGQMALECSRCGKRYSHELRDDYRLRLEPVQGNVPDDPEGEQALAESGLCLGEDLEAGWYRGPLLRLDDFFGEVIALAMPIQPLCEESCPGVCHHCGETRRRGEPRRLGGVSQHHNGEPQRSSRESHDSAQSDVVETAGCNCQDEKIESPFAVLAKLKTKTQA